MTDPICDSAVTGCHGSLQAAWSTEGQSSSLASLDDTELVDLAVGSNHDPPNPEAFGELYERHMNAVYAFALSRLRNLDDAEDITSQTFLQALQALPRYEHRGVQFLTWLFRITYNLIAGRYRASSGTAASPHLTLMHPAQGDERVLDLPDPDAAAAITEWEATEEFGRLLLEVTSEQRRVLRLRFGDDMPIAVVALKTGHSEGAVKALQSRATRELRRRLELADWETLALQNKPAPRRSTGPTGTRRIGRRSPACAPAI